MLSTSPERIALKHIILAPRIGECCGEPIVMRNRPSFPLVYTTKGAFFAALYNGECHKGCSKKFTTAFTNRETSSVLHPTWREVLPVQLANGADIALLEGMTNNISISATSFESCTKMYNENCFDSDVAKKKHL